MVPAAPHDRVVLGRGIVARSLGDTCQQRRLVDVIGGEGRQRLAEIVLGGPGEPVLSMPHVDLAHVARENLFLGAALGAESGAHLLLDPERQPQFLALPDSHIDVPRADQRGQHTRQGAVGAKLVAVLDGGLLPEKDAAHQLLGDGRSALGKDRRPAPEARLCSPGQASGQGADPHLADHARKTEVVDAVMREEALVLGGEKRLPDDRRDVVVVRDVAVLVGQFDERLAVGVVDTADGRKLEADEGVEIGEVVAAGVDVMQLASCNERGSRHHGEDDRRAGQHGNHANRPGRPGRRPPPPIPTNANANANHQPGSPDAAEPL